MRSPTPSARPGHGMVVSRSPAFTELPTSQGRTSITDEVVQTIAGLAARQVTGIYSIGGGGERFAALRERTSGPGGHNLGRGVSVEFGGRGAAVDLEVVVEYGVAITPLVQAVRRNVVEWVQTMTGLEVIEVNITVTDLHLPDDEPVQVQ